MRIRYPSPVHGAMRERGHPRFLRDASMLGQLKPRRLDRLPSRWKLSFPTATSPVAWSKA
jgi:hypothetical protein